MRKIKLILVLVLTSFVLQVQSLNMISVPQKSTIVVTGTSTLHGWEMKLTEVQSSFNINKPDESKIEISEGQVRFKTENLKSDNSGLNSKAYEALKTDKHPQVTFIQTGKLTASIVNKKFKAKVRGNLTIAGTTKAVELDVEGEQLGENILRIRGEKPMKMTDFGVTPPRAMLGTIRSGDDINIKFDITFQQ